MAVIKADVIRIEDTAAQVKARLRNQQLGVANDDANQIIYKMADGSFEEYLPSGTYLRTPTLTSGTFPVAIDSDQIGDGKIYMDGAKIVASGNLEVKTISNAASDTDRFLVSDSGEIKYRTGAEVLSDIGGVAVSSLTSGYLPNYNGSALIDSPAYTDGTNIGIGKVPSQKLDVSGSVGIATGGSLVNAAGTDYLKLNSNHVVMQAGDTNHQIIINQTTNEIELREWCTVILNAGLDGSTGAIGFEMNSVEKARFNNSGQLTVGGTSATGLINVQASGDSRISWINNDGDGVQWSLANDWNGENNFTLVEEGVSGNRLCVTAGAAGSFGVNTSTFTMLDTGAVATMAIAHSASAYVSLRAGADSEAMYSAQNDARQWRWGIAGDDTWVLYDDTGDLHRIVIDTAGKTGFQESGPYNMTLCALSAPATLDPNWGMFVQWSGGVANDYNVGLSYYPDGAGTRRCGIYDNNNDRYVLYADHSNPPDINILYSNIIVGEDKWIGIGSSSERIVFDGSENEVGIRGCDILLDDGAAIKSVSVGAFVSFEDVAAGVLGLSGSTHIISLNKHGIGDMGTVDRWLHVEEEDNVTNDTAWLLRLSHFCGATQTNDFGVGMEFELESATYASGTIAGTISCRWYDESNSSSEILFDQCNRVVFGDLVEIVSMESLGVGTETAPYASGFAKVAVHGNDSQGAGPHVQYTTTIDDYPLFQQLNWTHDNVCLSFDSYYAGSFRSSDAGSNFAIYKYSDKLNFRYNSGTAAGADFTWSEGFALDSSGNVELGRDLTVGGDIIVDDGSWIGIGNTDTDPNIDFTSIYGISFNEGNTSLGYWTSGGLVVETKFTVEGEDIGVPEEKAMTADYETDCETPGIIITSMTNNWTLTLGGTPTKGQKFYVCVANSVGYSLDISYSGNTESIGNSADTRFIQYLYDGSAWHQEF